MEKDKVILIYRAFVSWLKFALRESEVIFHRYGASDAFQ